MDADTAVQALLTPQGRDDPYPLYAALHAAGPVVPLAGGYVVAHGYAAVDRVLRDPAFLVEDAEFIQRIAPGWVGEHPSLELLTDSMLKVNPPDHERMRRLVTKAFTARRVAAMRPWIEELAERLLDELSGVDQVDLIDAFANRLPIQVLCELVGIPAEDQHDFRRWARAILTGPMNMAEWPPALIAMVEYIRKLLVSKRRQLGDDLLSALLAVREEGDRLSDDELISMVYLFLIAGHETTTNLIANGMLLLLAQPQRWDRVVAEPHLLPAIIEELLRYEGPVQCASFRIVVEPVELGGQQLPAGASVLPCLLSANHDEARFDDADRFDPARSASPNLAFGHGIHYCLGAPLARLEGQIAFHALARRFPGMRLAVPVNDLAWRPSLLIRGLSALPVRLG
jgi:cytochrome P450